MKSKISLLGCQLVLLASALLMPFHAGAQNFGQTGSTSYFTANVTGSLGGSCVYAYLVTVSASEQPVCVTYGNNTTFQGAISVSCWITNVSGVQPAGTPVVFFGTGGTIGANGTPVPYTIPIQISSPDTFFAGNSYNISGNDLVGQSWNFSYGVNLGPFSVSGSPPSSQPVTLSAQSPYNASQINIQDAVSYNSSLSGGDSGVFENGGHMSFSGFMTGEAVSTGTGPEVGTVTINVPVHLGQMFNGYLGDNRIVDIGLAGTIPMTINYARSDFVPNPTISISANSYQIAVGATTTVTVTIKNPSQYFTVSSGQLYLNLEAQGGSAFITGGSGNTINIGSIGPGASQTYNFTVQGQTAGNVLPQAFVSNVQWGNPLDCKATFSSNVALSQDISVYQPTGSLQVTINPSGAVSAGAQWQADNNGAWHNSGATISGLSVGSHTISFSAISGWTAPGNQNVTINNGSTTMASGTYAQQTGSLQVTINPSGAVSAGAQWRVDGGAWQNNGTTISGLSVGSHTISFSTIGGWNTPGNQNVTINNGLTTTASGSYTQQTGSLQVTINPSGAVSAGAQWQVDGGTWQNSGNAVSGLTVGNHTLHFSSIAGWYSPGDQVVSISNGFTTTANGTYTTTTGSLQVTISPSDAVSAGAQWQVDGGAWQNSGAIISGLSVGSHTVSFSTISGWTTPANQLATISANQTAQPTGTYVATSQTGSLQVTISPASAVSAGAQWLVDGGAWQNNGVTVSGLSVGSHTVSFSAISSWITATNQTVTVSANQTTQVTGTYAPIPQLSVSPSSGLSASGFQGGPYTPSSLQYSVSNTAAGTLNWTVIADQPWVTLSQSSGQNVGPVTVSINTNANSLYPGTYYSTLTFGGDGGSTNVQVELTIISSGQFFIWPACVNGLQANINGVTYFPRPGGQVTNIVFNWGDGQQAAGYFPNSHTYSSAGNYTVQVTSQYSDGSCATLSQTFYAAPGVLLNCVACEISASQGGSVSYQSSIGSGTVSAGTTVTLQQAYADDAFITANSSGDDFFFDWSPSSGMTGINATPVATNSPSVTIVIDNNSQITANFSPLAFGIGSTPWGSDGLHFMLYAPAGSNIVVQASTNLINWIPIYTNVGSFMFTDPNATNYQHRFYRAIMMQTAGPIINSTASIVGTQALQSEGTNSSATSLSLPTAGQLYVYGVATGGANTMNPIASGQTIRLTNADGYASAQLAVSTNNSDSFTTGTSYHVFGGLGVSNVVYVQGFYGVNLGPGPNLQASVQFTLNAPAMVAVIGMGSSQTTMSFSGLDNPIIDVPAQNGTSGTEALSIEHEYVETGTYTIQETTADGISGQDPNHEVDLMGVLIFSASSNAATSSNAAIPLPVGF